ncbi:MAG: hypothetical protein ACI4PF_00900, partial [Christensenellales bacterium]
NIFFANLTPPARVFLFLYFKLVKIRQKHPLKYRLIRNFNLIKSETYNKKHKNFTQKHINLATLEPQHHIKTIKKQISRTPQTTPVAVTYIYVYIII